MAARNHIEVVARTMAVLEAIARFEGSADLKTIAAKVGIGKSTVFRILFTLKELGYIEQSGPGGMYSTTAKVFALARSPVEKPRLIALVHPHLVRLRDELQESAWFAQWRYGLAVLMDVVESPHPLRLSYDVGDRCPLHASALGKAIAAHLPTDELEAILAAKPLAGFTRNTIARRDDLMKELARVRQRGYALNNQETIEGAVVIGAAILARQKHVVGAISVSAPTARCPMRKRQEIIASVKRTSQSISEALLHAGPIGSSRSQPAVALRTSKFEAAP